MRLRQLLHELRQLNPRLYEIVMKVYNRQRLPQEAVVEFHAVMEKIHRTWLDSLRAELLLVAWPLFVHTYLNLILAVRGCAEARTPMIRGTCARMPRTRVR